MKLNELITKHGYGIKVRRNYWSKEWWFQPMEERTIFAFNENHPMIFGWESNQVSPTMQGWGPNTDRWEIYNEEK